MKISVIIPTHNRHEKLRETVLKLREQDFPSEDYEIIVVDDTSTPPVSVEQGFNDLPKVFVIRLEGAERSLARNTGAKTATGELLIFVDNDILVNKEFLSAHWRTHQDFSNALAVGKIILPAENQNEPFVRFRQRLELTGVPRKYGVVKEKNFCAAANLSIKRDLFFELSGFDLTISSGEDQDLALRHTAKGGKIIFVPDAIANHCDNALDIRTYCQRNEWGSRLMRPFYERYPNLPQNVERERINGFIKWRNEPISSSVRKFVKSIISSRLMINGLFLMANILERTSPNSKLLDRIYRMLLGAHIFRGYRAAMTTETNILK